jgi:transcription antitermination factor NusG
MAGKSLYEIGVLNEEDSPLEFPWFALQVRSNQERTAARHLKSRGFEEYVPWYKTERDWSDRKKIVEASLFPGYVFCRLNPNDRLLAVSVPGVVGIVGFGGIPEAIPLEELGRVRAMVDSGLLISPWPFLQKGQTVLIERGPLEGVEGILAEVKGKWRLVVSINILCRSVSTEIDRTWVRPIPSGPARVSKS